MSHHSIIFTCIGNSNIPEEHQRSLNKFVGEIGFHGELTIDGTSISFHCRESCWFYQDDIRHLIKKNKITLEMIEAYRWLRENTDVKSDCWNPCDCDYGPDSWSHIEKSLDFLKDRIKESENRLKGIDG